jgi:hypothetical protein
MTWQHRIMRRVEGDKMTHWYSLCKAADNLCEAAKVTNGFIELCGNTTERLAKAIADYEGKGEK